MTSSYDAIVTVSGQVLTSSVFNQTQENIRGAVEQASGAPYARLPYLSTIEGGSWQSFFNNSVSAVFFNSDLNMYMGYDAQKDQFDFVSKLPYLQTSSRDAWLLSDSDAAVVFNPTVQQYEGYNPLTKQWGTIGGGKSFITILSSGHGYTESGDTGLPLYWSGSYMQSDASTPSKADVLGLLSKVIDVNQFEIQQTGPLTLNHSRWNDVFSGGIVEGAYYWLQGSGLGTYVDCSPDTDGWVDKPVLYAITSAEALILNLRGAEIGGAYSRQKSFTVTDVESNLVRFQHNFGTAQPAILVFNEENQRVSSVSSYEPTSGNPLNSTDVFVSSATMVEVGSHVWIIKGIGTGAKTVVNLSDQLPLTDIDSASAGTGEEVSRYDHRHPTPRRTACLWSDPTTYGSVDNKIVRFTTQLESCDNVVVTVTENSSAATRIIANMDCAVQLKTNLGFTSPSFCGISKNSNQLTTPVNSIDPSHLMDAVAAGSNLPTNAIYMSTLNSGDILRIHTEGAVFGTLSDTARLSIFAIEIPQG